MSPVHTIEGARKGIVLTSAALLSHRRTVEDVLSRQRQGHMTHRSLDAV
jgi:hypothetical protein